MSAGSDRRSPANDSDAAAKAAELFERALQRRIERQRRAAEAKQERRLERERKAEQARRQGRIEREAAATKPPPPPPTPVLPQGAEPPEQVRIVLAHARRFGVNFDAAWDSAVESLGPLPRHVRRSWLPVLHNTRSAWEAAYEGIEGSPRIDLVALSLLTD
jgi:hypothetical protein